MPSSTKAGQEAGTARGGRAAPRSRSGGRTREARLLTLAQATKARPSETGPGEDEKVTRSFRIRKDILARLQGGLHGVQARSYGTPLADQVPASLGDFVDEALEAALTYYENMLNDGQEFDRSSVRLQPGPVPGRSRRQPAATART